jgi:dTDP-glucose 4,6-dehydratase
MLNLLITGGCGFIGSKFINYYFYKYPNINIINLDALYDIKNDENILHDIRKSDRYIFVKGNICCQDLINYILYNYKIDTVLHLAAQTKIDNSFENSLQYTKDNIMGTHTLLECCRKYNGINKFIYMSTDEVYSDSLSDKTDNNIIYPMNPYAATKAGCELMAQSYYRSYNFPLIITRLCNVYGCGQCSKKVIPKFIKLLKNDEKISIYGDGNNKLSFLHINDVLNAIRIILENGILGEIYDVTCDENMLCSVLDIAKLLILKIKQSNNFTKFIEHINDRPFCDKRYKNNNTKLKNMGWNINVDFNLGLENIINI